MLNTLCTCLPAAQWMRLIAMRMTQRDTNKMECLGFRVQGSGVQDPPAWLSNSDNRLICKQDIDDDGCKQDTDHEQQPSH